MEAFSQFLRTEFSEENIEFWLACEEYKTIDSKTKLLSKAKYIYAIFIESDSPKEVWHGMFIYHKLHGCVCVCRFSMIFGSFVTEGCGRFKIIMSLQKKKTVGKF